MSGELDRDSGVNAGASLQVARSGCSFGEEFASFPIIMVGLKVFKLLGLQSVSLY